MFRTHYDDLQVARNASQSVIRAAYKTLTQQWHPDKHPENVRRANTITKRIDDAYRVLSDPELRKKHDDWIEQQEGQESGARNRSARYSSNNDFDDNCVSNANAPRSDDDDRDYSQDKHESKEAASDGKICPKCKYERKAADGNPEWQCPSCGVVYAKYESTSQVSDEKRVNANPGKATQGSSKQVSYTRFLWSFLLGGTVVLFFATGGTLGFAVGSTLPWFLAGVILSPMWWLITKTWRRTAWKWFDWLNAATYMMMFLFLLKFTVDFYMHDIVGISDVDGPHMSNSRANRDFVRTFRKNYYSGCIKKITSGPDGITLSIGRPVCECITEGLIASVPEYQLREFNDNPEASLEPVRPMAEECVDKVISGAGL